MINFLFYQLAQLVCDVIIFVRPIPYGMVGNYEDPNEFIRYKGPIEILDKEYSNKTN